jgi:hypothetical protein
MGIKDDINLDKLTNLEKFVLNDDLWQNLNAISVDL